MSFSKDQVLRLSQLYILLNHTMSLMPEKVMPEKVTIISYASYYHKLCQKVTIIVDNGPCKSFLYSQLSYSGMGLCM